MMYNACVDSYVRPEFRTWRCNHQIKAVRVNANLYARVEASWDMFCLGSGASRLGHLLSLISGMGIVGRLGYLIWFRGYSH